MLVLGGRETVERTVYIIFYAVSKDFYIVNYYKNPCCELYLLWGSKILDYGGALDSREK